MMPGTPSGEGMAVIAIGGPPISKLKANGRDDNGPDRNGQ